MGAGCGQAAQDASRVDTLATGLVGDALTLFPAPAAVLAPFPERLTHFATPSTPGHSAPA